MSIYLLFFFARARAEFVKSTAQDTFKGSNGGNNKNTVTYMYVVATENVLSLVNERDLSLLDSLVSH